MKKTLRTILLERTDTIEYRSIKKRLMVIAQNGGNQLILLHLSVKAQIQLNNEQIDTEKFNDHGYEKWKISW
jgi:hypothetical protein